MNLMKIGMRILSTCMYAKIDAFRSSRLFLVHFVIEVLTYTLPDYCPDSITLNNFIEIVYTFYSFPNLGASEKRMNTIQETNITVTHHETIVIVADDANVAVTKRQMDVTVSNNVESSRPLEEEEPSKSRLPPPRKRMIDLTGGGQKKFYSALAKERFNSQLREETLSKSKLPIARKRTARGLTSGCQKPFSSTVAKEFDSCIHVDSSLEETDPTKSKLAVATKRTAQGLASRGQKKFRSSLTKELSSLHINLDLNIIKDRLSRANSLIYIDVAQDPYIYNRSQWNTSSSNAESNVPTLQRDEKNCFIDQPRDSLPTVVDASQSKDAYEIQIPKSEMNCSIDPAFVNDKISNVNSLVYIDVAQDPYIEKRSKWNSLNTESNVPTLLRYQENFFVIQPNKPDGLPTTVDESQSKNHVYEVQIPKSEMDCSTEFEDKCMRDKFLHANNLVYIDAAQDPCIQNIERSKQNSLNAESNLPTLQRYEKTVSSTNQMM